MICLNLRVWCKSGKTGLVTFPMYVFPHVRRAMRDFWKAVDGELEARGVVTFPVRARHSGLLCGWFIPKNLKLMQYCSYPYVTKLRKRGKLAPIACFDYNIEGVEDAKHASLIVVRHDSPAQSLEDTRGLRVVINGTNSNTGMNLLRHAVAPLADGKRFFRKVKKSGAHAASMRQIIKNKADVAAVDPLSYAYFKDANPKLAAKLRIIGKTAFGPTLPLFVPIHTPQEVREHIIAAFAAVIADEKYTSLVHDTLHISGVKAISEADLDVILEYEAEATRLGYAKLI